jgi:hypothetical protein
VPGCPRFRHWAIADGARAKARRPALLGKGRTLFIPILVVAAAILGAAIGIYRAKKRGGKPLDMLQYAAAHAIPLMILAMFATIILDRSGH